LSTVQERNGSGFAAAVSPWNPGKHEIDLGDQNLLEWQHEMLCAIDPGGEPETHESAETLECAIREGLAAQGGSDITAQLPGEEEESFYHLVQDEEMIAEIHSCVLPPDEYYDELAVLWKSI
jgi:hypothetical protein